ncbi:alpha/beta hydrolase [Arenicella chitinivorans]|uniref:Alpha/beta hydrolase n=1 Tax=Arenicella chitinivorans TaxID=1329800 RepID=A0A918RF07_9GAMM|nr:alpha/beta hydrolase [Arenicella chitinivorans]GGZ96278.1 alpha/beta hydrolase [Arenicella chitinivorans]
MDLSKREFKVIEYTSQDGLKLYARDYVLAHGADARPVVLCMHGLTRNSADFEPLIPYLSERYRCVVVDQRGRGLSDYDSNSANYTPQTYAQDMFTLLAHLQIEKVTIIGTSMGGIIGMVMAAMQPQRVTALVLNDIGPEIPADALNRLKKYVGKLQPVTNWPEAIAQTKLINQIAFPDASGDDWAAFTARIYTEDSSGKPVLAYDPHISDAFNDDYNENRPADMWPLFTTIKDRPMLIIRGAISDLLTRECVTKMQQLNPSLHQVEVPRVGHAPMLDEPESIQAITKFLSQYAVIEPIA